MRERAVIYARGFGLANLEYDVPITPRTVFHVASVSKQFTAMAIALLADAGRLALDDDLHQYVPELHDFGRPITIRQLLHHTSGLRDQWDLLVLAGWRMDDVITTADVLDLLAAQRELNFEPGAEYLYCNSGYTLLGVIVERVSGQSLRQFAQERFFGPLGMADTHFHDDHTELVKNRAYSYEPKPGGGYRHMVLSYATVGASSLFTTVEDLARWDDNFYSGMVGGPAVLQQMQTRGRLTSGDRLTYALGLSVSSYRGLPVVEHSGGDAGFRSHLLRFPEQQFSVAVLSNLSTARPGHLARRVADALLEQAFPLPAQSASADGPRPAERDLQDYAGLYYSRRRNETQRLEWRDGRLHWAVGPGVELIPAAGESFQAPDSPSLEIRFVRGEAGQVRELQLAEAGMAATPYARVTPAALSPEALQEYAGTYYSPELDVTYRIELDQSGLGLSRRKYACVPLEPTVPDGFVGNGVDYLFERDGAQAVCGFRLTTGRVRNLSFVREPR